MIDLGLKRIARLVRDQGKFPWRAIHVAGTNGKGSVCAYISSCLKTSGIASARFTSPHLVDRWDCITLNGAVVSEDLFLATEAAIKQKDAEESIGASEFEILTATAFEIFSRERVDVAVVEVGIGGRLDATNIIEPPVAAVITKIGLEHQGFLGSSVEEIAKEKGGIIKGGSMCIVDGMNEEGVLSVLGKIAEEVGVESFHAVRPEMVDGDGGVCEITTEAFGRLRFDRFLSGNYQPANLSCAVHALSYLSREFPSITASTVLAGVRNTSWPGRMETVDVSCLLPGKERRVLLDGAHNTQAALALSDYVTRKLRTGGKFVSWTIAVSKGKDVKEMLRILLRPGDKFVAVEFGPVDGMPWVVATGTEEIIGAVREVFGEEVGAVDGGSDVLGGVKLALELAGEKGRTVVAGSL
ncbi:FolC bifunctional protein [Choiromyces venosus 120613-1]|uniref:Dihydrofolate synthetase n=1 Tax=Choiromyces venosus 120613-1 TaxID=1336337 RepID=A0A3N4JFR4_9PEZI|nr:FolC bifunctional protein [Choiromyces venosus 120613-1]